MDKLTVVVRSADAAAEGIYQNGEMVMSALTAEWLGFRWSAFAGATDAEVVRWYGILRERLARKR